MMAPGTSRATALTLSQSPREAAGKPASITSTPRSASARATRSFSARAMLHPGDCSPSRSVVSKMITGSGAVTICMSSCKPSDAAQAIVHIGELRGEKCAAFLARQHLAVQDVESCCEVMLPPESTMPTRSPASLLCMRIAPARAAAPAPSAI